MGSKWRKMKHALGFNLCYVPKTSVVDDGEEEEEFNMLPYTSAASTPLVSHALAFSKSSKVFSCCPPADNKYFCLSPMFLLQTKTCSICLASLRQGGGHAIFTAECAHSFHFQCIALNAKHGNQTCPVCRAKWKEIPLQSPTSDPLTLKARVNPVGSPQSNDLFTMVYRLPPRLSSNRLIVPLFQAPEPAVFDDDESLDHQTDRRSSTRDGTSCRDEHRTVEIRTYTEFPEVQRLSSVENFTVLVHLKAPASNSIQNTPGNGTYLPRVSQTPRAPVDLVTVLDTSGSMAGTKLALVKRAMGFLIQNLCPNDRLAVIAFSSTAHRLFPLRRMSESGKHQALLAVNALVANGGTNIAEGLKKASKVMEDRREKNPVASIILLSDGQDTYTLSNSSEDQQLLVPFSSRKGNGTDYKIPVHTFGFGSDHDASSMHSISEVSGGTFSFIETESVIQDAFAQCIGGLLSVVVRHLQVIFECVDPRVSIGSMKVGSYPNCMMPDRRAGSIGVGDLYADEERDFLVSVNIPEELTSHETSLLRVRCIYNDPLIKNTVTLGGEEVRIRRPEIIQPQCVPLEVDRQKSRIRAAQAMAEARTAAENGNLVTAASILESCRKELSETVSAKSQDQLCLALDAELKEMQERMASRQVYETSGRAYILSGLSSHSWQRATARGDSTHGSSLVQAYQTPLMAEMLSRSQATLLGSPSTRQDIVQTNLKPR